MKTKMKFAPGEGCAGLCFETQVLTYIDIENEYSESNANQKNAYKKEIDIQKMAKHLQVIVDGYTPFFKEG